MKLRVFHLIAILIIGLASAGPICAPLFAQSDSGSDKSWTSTTDSTSETNSPIRTTDTHTQSGNRTLDTHSVQQLSPNGGYEPYLDVETETVKVDAATTRTIERTYTRGANGERVLSQVTEQEQKSLGGGELRTVRNTSNPDPDGDLQLVRREVENLKPTSPNSQDIHTTVFLPSANGGLAATTQIDEHQTKTGDKSMNYQRTTAVSDGNGNWQTSETRQGTIQQDGKQRTSEERISRADSEGNMSVVSRTVNKETEGAAGEKSGTTEVYSTNVPGITPDGALHLTQRTTTTTQIGPGGASTTVQQVQQPNPGNPSSGMRVTVQTTDTATPSGGITRDTRTVRSLDGGGDLSVVSVDMGKSDKPVTIQIAPPSPPKPKQ